jgi:carbamoylphosphate synthase small subunit
MSLPVNAIHVQCPKCKTPFIGTVVVEEPDPTDEQEEVGRQAAVVENLKEEISHWREHCKAVDDLCSRGGIPTHRDDGTRIFTEDRVKMLLEEHYLWDSQ